MGYTSASSYSASQASTNTMWLDQVSCTQSCDCLSGCFSRLPQTPIICSDNLGFVQVQCTYDVKIQNQSLSGNKDICTNNQGTCGNHAKSSFSTVTIIAICCGVLIISLIFTAIASLFVYIKVKRKGYISIQN